LRWDARLADAPWLRLQQFLYCLWLAVVLELAMRALGMRHGRWRPIRRRTAGLLVVACVGVALSILVLRYAQSLDV
jgi:hypothetical protein